MLRGIARATATATATSITLVTSDSISGITQATSAVVTTTSSQVEAIFDVGTQLLFSGVTGMTQINGLTGTVTAVGGAAGAWTYTVNINSTSFSAYSSGGTAALAISAYDTMILVAGGGSTSATITWPPGFGAIPGLANQNVAGASGSCTNGISWKLATASETGSYAITFSGSANYNGASLYVFYGRLVNPFVVNPALTPAVGAAATPVTCSITKLTPNSGDDVLLSLPLGENSGTDTITLTPPTGWTAAATNHSTTTFEPAFLACYYLDNPGGTAIPATSPTFTDTSGYSIGYCGYLISLAGGPQITGQPVNDAIAPGSTATFSVTAQSANGTLSYQWQMAPPQAGVFGAILGAPGTWSNIPSATSASYTTPALYQNGTWYRCLVSDPVGSVVSLPARAWLTGQSAQGKGAFALGSAKARKGRDLRAGSSTFTRMLSQFGYTPNNQTGYGSAIFYFYPPGLSGVAASFSGSTGNLTGSSGGGGALASAAASFSAAIAALMGAGALEGAAASISAAEANLSGAAPLAGVAASFSSASGFLASVLAFSGVGASFSAGIGALLGKGALAGAAASLSGAQASLTGVGFLASGAVSLSMAIASLTGSGALASGAVSLSAAEGALTGAGALEGVAASFSAAVGDLVPTSSGSMAGVAASWSSASGQLLGKAALSGVAASLSAATALLGATVPIAGAAASFSGASGSLAGHGALSGVAASLSSAIGQLRGAGFLASAAASLSSASGSLVPGSGPTAGVAASFSVAIGALTSGPAQQWPDEQFNLAYDARRIALAVDGRRIEAAFDERRIALALDLRRPVLAEQQPRAQPAEDQRRAALALDERRASLAEPSERIQPEKPN